MATGAGNQTHADGRRSKARTRIHPNVTGVRAVITQQATGLVSLVATALDEVRTGGSAATP